jgi:hypothetical protein
MEYAREDIVLPHRLLLDAYPDQLRRLTEWALTPGRQCLSVE